MFLCGVSMLWLLQRFPVAGALLQLVKSLSFVPLNGAERCVTSTGALAIERRSVPPGNWALC